MSFPENLPEKVWRTTELPFRWLREGPEENRHEKRKLAAEARRKDGEYWRVWKQAWGMREQRRTGHRRYVAIPVAMVGSRPNSIGVLTRGWAPVDLIGRAAERQRELAERMKAFAEALPLGPPCRPWRRRRRTTRPRPSA